MGWSMFTLDDKSVERLYNLTSDAHWKLYILDNTSIVQASDET